MIIDVPSTDVVKIYRTLVEVVTPRPIAWVTTIDAEGRVLHSGSRERAGVGCCSSGSLTLGPGHRSLQVDPVRVMGPRAIRVGSQAAGLLGP